LASGRITFLAQTRYNNAIMRLARTKKIITLTLLALALTLPLQLAAASPHSQEDTPVPLAQVITNTPNPDGIILHTVQYGETLTTIAQAYEVSIDQILSNSGLSATTTELREGQELLIQTAQEPTITLTPTPTEEPATPTPTQPRPTMTPFPTRTPAPTYTPTPAPSILLRALGESTSFGIGLILVCGLGLILVIYMGFLKKA
jgi:LysM repeat protein